MRKHDHATAALTAAGVFHTGLAAPAGVSETFRGDAPESGLHRLLTGLTREHPPGVQGTRGESLARKGAPFDTRCARDRPRAAARQADDEAGPAP